MIHSPGHPGGVLSEELEALGISITVSLLNVNVMHPGPPAMIS